jgi:glycosyltransferase involved in cell wall biosynthesis
MRILIVSHAFLPNLGGIETASDALARAFVRRGHDVTVVTETPSDRPDDLPYAVLRRPRPGALLAAVGACEVCLHNNISLRAAWPLLLRPRRWVVAHQTGLRRPGGCLSLADRAKRLALRFARSIAISKAVAADLPVPATIIPNPYRDDVFQRTNDGPRLYELAFVGRLVSDKGAALLLEALALLARDGLDARLLLIGSGPEEAALRARATALGLDAQVDFAGPRRGAELAGLLNQARILVVPSLWAEPFGIVALEGIACGCVVVGSALGGLPEAIGPCGVTFPNGDAAALAAALDRLLRDPASAAPLLAAAPAHLARHTADAVGDAYLKVLAA